MRFIAVIGILLLLAGCQRIVTIPSPTPLPACPSPTEEIKAVATSQIDPTVQPTVIAAIDNNSKEKCATLVKAHSDEWNALLARASEAGKNISDDFMRMMTIIISVIGTGFGIYGAAK